MNLDRFCQCFVVSLLPILWLPKHFLLAGMGIAWLFLLLGIARRERISVLLALLIGLSYVQVDQIAKKVDALGANKRSEKLYILQILKQQEYQTALAELSDGTRLFVNWQNKTPLILAANYQAIVHFRPISGRLNEGNFNRQKWYLAQHIEGIATVKQAQLLSLSPPTNIRANWLYRVKQHTEGLSMQGLLLALAFGERAWLSEQDWKHFQQTSTAHLIAISGLHIGLAFGFGFWIMKLAQWVWLNSRRKQEKGQLLFWAKFSGLSFALGYSFLAGFAIPTLRALLAIFIVLACQQWRRYYTPWQLWWRVIAILLLCDPLSLLSDSFWLSILAVAALIFWYQHFPLNHFLWQTFYKKQSKFTRFIVALLHLQLGILIVFCPVQLWFFEGVSPFAFVANLLIVPLYSLGLVPVILFSLMTDNLLNTWQFADSIASLSMALITPLSHAWFPLSYSQQITFISLNVLLLAIIYGVIWRKSKKYWLGSGILLALFNRSFTCVEQWREQPIAEWLHFDVGQGLAMALVYQTGGQKRAIFYDTGASWSSYSAAEQEILPYLAREGIDVEAIFVSHDDNDHAGGVLALLKAYPQARLILSGKNRYAQYESEPCIAGKKWQFSTISLQAFYPLNAVERAGNADSCVLGVHIGKFKLLFTGDSEKAQERHYAQAVGKVDFLQVGHHGSQTSTSETLLAHTQPIYALISAGRWNAWHHPNANVMARLQAHHIQPFNTAYHGMIKITFYREHYQIQTARRTTSPWYSAYFGEARKNHSYFPHNRLK